LNKDFKKDKIYIIINHHSIRVLEMSGNRWRRVVVVVAVVVIVAVIVAVNDISTSCSVPDLIHHVSLRRVVAPATTAAVTDSAPDLEDQECEQPKEEDLAGGHHLDERYHEEGDREYGHQLAASLRETRHHSSSQKLRTLSSSSIQIRKARVVLFLFDRRQGFSDQIEVLRDRILHVIFVLLSRERFVAAKMSELARDESEGTLADMNAQLVFRSKHVLAR